MAKYAKTTKRSGKEAYLHRALLERKLKRPLSKRTHIHHKNKDKKDNRLSNLKPMSISEHLRYHYKKGDYHKLTKAEMRRGAMTTNKKLYGK